MRIGAPWQAAPCGRATVLARQKFRKPNAYACSRVAGQLSLACSRPWQIATGGPLSSWVTARDNSGLLSSSSRTDRVQGAQRHRIERTGDVLSRVLLRAANRADGHRAPARVRPAPIVLWAVRVRKAGELEVSACQREAVITSNPLLAGVEDAHPEQRAVIRVRERQVVRHGRDRWSVRSDSRADQAN